MDGQVFRRGEWASTGFGRLPGDRGGYRPA